MGEWTSVFMIGITRFRQPLRFFIPFPNQPNINFRTRNRTLHLFHKQ